MLVYINEQAYVFPSVSEVLSFLSELDNTTMPIKSDIEEIEYVYHNVKIRVILK